MIDFVWNPWDKFLEDWGKIQEILIELEDVKKVDLIENMQDYIFKSRRVVRTLCRFSVKFFLVT